MNNFRATCGNSWINKKNYVEAVKKTLEGRHVFRYYRGNTISETTEKQISNFFSCCYCRLLCNATAALKCALMALKPKVGEIVLVPRYTFIATANAVLSAGLIPKLVEVDRNGHMSPDMLNHMLDSMSKKGILPRAVIAVHLDGSSCEISEIKKITENYKISLIEDVSQSFGSSYNGKLLGTFGDFGCFSFQENKILSSGEGGAFICNNKLLFNRASQYADNGCLREGELPRWGETSFFGENYKVTEICSSIILEQLKAFYEIESIMKKNYLIVTEELERKGIAFKEREEGDVPVSIRFCEKKSIEIINKAKISNFSWDMWDLYEHPIVKCKLSPYANAFPWNLDSSDIDMCFKKARYICVSMPIPLDEKEVGEIRQKLRKI